MQGHFSDSKNKKKEKEDPMKGVLSVSAFCGSSLIDSLFYVIIKIGEAPALCMTLLFHRHRVFTTIIIQKIDKILNYVF